MTELEFSQLQPLLQSVQFVHVCVYRLYLDTIDECTICDHVSLLSYLVTDAVLHAQCDVHA